ncbi:ASCH domain-containing protein [Paenibacillus hunanensis]|uniref:ASCH domain-containing protein n=1 Tax=Paenibacillus hunanensis TaxID=539262 RepID=A0ABU1IW06_9BACL|nr:ASCH domain-containing protein [Paenibacillus hunanensis]MDR6243446.1 hypothetical protein [Paenibacillus hunanensis]GGI97786.1 hypothetical protein GCM10008022_03100 [Paenibacillus hunanensis]
MKAITIRQPWATLIMLREKHFETRSWKTNYRGPIAIHAGLVVDFDALNEPLIAIALKSHGYKTISDLPTGAIIGRAMMTNCFKSIDMCADGYLLEGDRYIASPESYYGDFTVGRFAWELTEVEQWNESVEAKGKQGLWEWDHERVATIDQGAEGRDGTRA